ncbi:MAG TPA: tRNA (5-methylaminomethyl-2-thiouridine)(34)-methyltransferase MnmD [Mucilaginibacter sp.]|nr:tRNA (5-methylaminomethyl-2-thiouridine)(34)-methyltransferase MnmD [Mucilaginibacter sp.]
MNHELTLVTTADGSKTIFNPAVGENYHSRHGALQESKHVFVNAGLDYFLSEHQAKQASILEVGFGTGLNFLLSADYCSEKSIELHYTGIEAYPLTIAMLSQTGYDEYVPETLWKAFIHSYPDALTAPTVLPTANGSLPTENLQLQIANCQLLNFHSAQQFDVIYFDAFAAIHQPEMWNEEAISHTVKFLKPGGVFVTYAITGNLKRMLKSLGLEIQKIPGAAGKREMLRAIKLI